MIFSEEELYGWVNRGDCDCPGCPDVLKLLDTAKELYKQVARLNQGIERLRK